MCSSPLFRLAAVEPSYTRVLLSYLEPGPGFVVKQDGLVVNRQTRDSFIASSKAIAEDFQQVPCRRCIECRLAYARNWAMRIVNEASLYQDNYVISLTYDELHLPKRTIFHNPVELANFDETDELDLEFMECGTLEKTAISGFMKRLRDSLRRKGLKKSGVRFFGCGEYGETFMRPHYHLILFNCPLPDLVYIGKSASGVPMYHSQLIADAWNDCDKTYKAQIGRITVQELDYDAAAYVAGYTLKKADGRNTEEAELQRICNEINKDGDLHKLITYCSLIRAEGGTPSNSVLDPFVTMSRRPGIGSDWIKSHPNVYETDAVNIKSKGKLITLKPATYYDKIFSHDHAFEFEKLKERRQISAKNKQKLLFQSYDGLSEDEIKAQAHDRLVKKRKKRGL